MAKRFIDSGLFMDEWFFELDDKAKLFWIYYLTNCDHAGFLPFNKKLIAFQIGCEPNSIETVLKQFDNRIRTVKDGLLFCPKFIRYQYSNGLSEKAPAQKSVIELLKRNGVNPTTLELLPNSLETVQDKDKDIDTDIGEEEGLGEEGVAQLGKSDGNLIQRMIFVWKSYYPKHVITTKSTPYFTTIRGMIRNYVQQEKELFGMAIPDDMVVEKLDLICRSMPPFWKDKITVAILAKESTFNSIMGELSKPQETVIAHDPRNRRI